MTGEQGKSRNDQVVRRIVASGEWTLESAAHFGGEDEGEEDMVLVRDGRGGLFIPGTSVAGAGRSYLAKRLCGGEAFGKGEETAGLEALFGGSIKKSHEGEMSALCVEDGVLGKASREKTGLRDGVRIDGPSGVAADKAKYDVEVIEPGVKFRLEMELVLRGSETGGEMERGGGKKPRASHKEMMECFGMLLRGFQEGEIGLGARTRRGYGKGRVERWEITDMLMGEVKGVVGWLRPTSRKGAAQTLGDFLKKEGLEKRVLDDRRRAFSIDAVLEIRSSLLVRSPSERPETADVSHLHAGGRPIVSGTSWAGVIRHRSETILRTVSQQGSLQRAGDSKSDGVAAKISAIFGDLHEGDRRPGRGAKLRAGRLFVEETTVEQGRTELQTRVAIDRFTGGASDQALYEEEPLRGAEGQKARTKFRLRLEEPKDEEIGLLLLVLKDLWNGLFSVGGEGSIGRGMLQGIEAVVCLRDPGKAAEALEWTLTSGEKGGLKIEGKNEAAKKHTVAPFVEALSRWKPGEAEAKPQR